MFQQYILRKAQTSSFYLWLLNRRLDGMVPFNKPHGFRLYSFTDWSLTTIIPYRRSNFNHLKGLHACALATISELTSGLLLIMKLNPKQYRIILQRLEMDYHFQGKMDAFGRFEISEQWLQEQIITPLTSADSVVVPCEVTIHDTAGNQLTTAKVFWQIKDWKKVKTKI